MKFPKTKRIKDRDLLDSVRDTQCVVCGKTPSDPDHIKSKGSGGDDHPSNIWALCRACHVFKHALGLNEFIRRNPSVVAILFDKGWHYDPHLKRWLGPKD